MPIAAPRYAAPPDVSDRYVTAVVFCVSAIYLLLRVPPPYLLLASNDQGYQMALGSAVAAGRLPGFDFITQYGPFVAFSSYAGLALTGNATGEMLICALGYAASIAVAISVVRRETGRIVAFVAFAALLLLLPRYYKWYYWLFPLLGLAAARRYWTVSWRHGNEPAMILAWGQIAGTAALFRYDLGLEGVVAGALAIAAADLSLRRVDRMRTVVAHVALFLLASAALPMLYLALIGALHDGTQVWIFIRSIYSGAVDTVKYLRNSAVPSRSCATHRTGSGTVSVTSHRACYVRNRNVCGRQEFSQKSARTVRAREYTLFCAALTGFGIFPQALHRADIHHLLQVIPPFIIVLAILGRVIVWNQHLYHRLGRVAGAAAIGLVLALLAMVQPVAGFDLGPLVRNPIRTWQMLAGLPGSFRSNPVADMALAIRRLTPPGSSVFLVMAPTDMPLLFFANRHQPGLFPTYQSGYVLRPVLAGTQSSDPRPVTTGFFGRSHRGRTVRCASRALYAGPGEPLDAPL